MKAIKVTKTIEEITGYQAEDGTIFTTEAECKKYEESAYAAVKAMFDKICVEQSWGGKEFAECNIFESFGYGGEEFCFVVADIKTEEDLKVANMYGKMRDPHWKSTIGTEYIGKRVLIALGNDCWDKVFYVRGTEDSMIEEFKRTMEEFFRPDQKGVTE